MDSAGVLNALNADTRGEAAARGWVLARARSGDRQAFAQLVAEHYDFIYRTACKWTGRRADAEDIAQEVCIKLATVIHGFDGRSAFTSWLYRVTLNAVRDFERAQRRHGRRIDALSKVHPEDTPPDQEDAVAASELWAAVRGLPEQQRDAVLLVYGEEMTHAAAAAIMGCREGTVSSHIHEARKALRGLV